MTALLAALALIAPGMHLNCHIPQDIHQRAPEAVGFAEVGGTHIWLTPTICRRLVNAVNPRKKRGRVTLERQGWAVHVLAHELAHHRGTSDERESDCWALGNHIRIARQLGIPKKEARRMRAFARYINARLVHVKPDDTYGCRATWALPRWAQ